MPAGFDGDDGGSLADVPRDGMSRLRSLAVDAFLRARGDRERATDLLREKVLADRELLDELVMPLVNKELWREISFVAGLFRRNPSYGAQPQPLPSEDPRRKGDARGIALKGERIVGIILTMDRITLPSGIRLGDATDDDLLAAIAHHRRLIAGSERAIHFYEAVLDAKRSARQGADTSRLPVREVLPDTLVARLHERYYSEQPGG